MDLMDTKSEDRCPRSPRRPLRPPGAGLGVKAKVRGTELQGGLRGRGRAPGGPRGVWPMRLWPGGACWDSLPANRPIGRGWEASRCAACGGRLRGALCTAPPMARADGPACDRAGPQEPAAARRQEAGVRLEPVRNEHYAGLRRPWGEWQARRGDVRWAQEGAIRPGGLLSHWSHRSLASHTTGSPPGPGCHAQAKLGRGCAARLGPPAPSLL